MNNLLQQYQHIPKLQKTKQLMNPYQSGTSATTQGQLSRIFLLNNRNKVSLSESQSQQQQQKEYNKNIIPTFSRLLTFERNQLQQSINKQPYTVEPTMTQKQQQKLSNTKTTKQQPHSKTIINPIKDINNNQNQKYFMKVYQQQYQHHYKFHGGRNKSAHSQNYQQHQYQSQQDDYSQEQYEQQITSTHITYNKNNNTNTNTNTNTNSNKDNNSKYNQSSTKKQALSPAHNQTQSNKQEAAIQSKTNNNSKYSIPTTTFPSINRNLFHKQGQFSASVPVIKQKKNISNNNTYNYHAKNDTIKQQQQQIADQQNTQNMISSKYTQQFSMSKITHSVKPSLQSASRIKQLNSEQIQSRRGSIIDQIIQQNFTQSNVFDGDHHHLQQKDDIQNNYKGTVHKKKQLYNYEQTPTKIKVVQQHNKKYNDKDFQHSMTVDQGTQTKKPRKAKIFSKTQRKQQRIPNLEYSIKQNPYNRVINSLNKLQYQDNNQPRRQQNYGSPQPKHRQHNQYSIYPKRTQQHDCSYKNVCKQTQCHLKLLQLVDKLTDRDNIKDKEKPLIQQHSGRLSKKQHLAIMKQNIQSQFLLVCVSVDQLSIEITLHQLLDSDVNGRVIRLKGEIQKLIQKIKNLSQISYIIGHEKKQSGYISAEYRWQLFEKLQKMCQTLHYIQIVQQRYKLWRSKLHYLKQQMRDMISLQKSKQIKKLGQIVKLMKQLESSKFYGNQNQVIGLVRSYNLFIDEQVLQLTQTVECIKNDILST